MMPTHKSDVLDQRHDHGYEAAAARARQMRSEYLARLIRSATVALARRVRRFVHLGSAAAREAKAGAHKNYFEVQH